jgi:hypothetical protein
VQSPTPEAYRQVTEAQLEIYRQKYDVFRHLDNLRWQVPTVVVSAASVLLGLGQGSQSSPTGWSLSIAGLLCFFGSFAIWRIRSGIKKNGAVLEEAAKAVGDQSIPEFKRGATFVLMWLLCLLGFVGGVIGVLMWCHLV